MRRALSWTLIPAVAVALLLLVSASADGGRDAGSAGAEVAFVRGVNFYSRGACSS